MIAAKKRNGTKSARAWLRGAVAWLLGPGRKTLLAAVVVGVVAGAVFKYKDRLLDSPEYRLDPRQVEITPPPDWVRCDLCTEVFRDPTLDGTLSIANDDLVERIAQAFERHPWVSRVVRVVKRHPPRVLVELEYRRAACMVEVPGGLLPVDVEGILLPSERFSPLEAARYPRLSGVGHMPNVPPGRRWPDGRIVGAAEIAAALSEDWEAMELQRIVPLAADPTVAPAGNGSRNNPANGWNNEPEMTIAGRPVEPFFALVTRGETRILWGYAPGVRAAGELSVEEKVARLRRYLADHDTLDDRRGRRQELDVRTMPPSTSHY